MKTIKLLLAMFLISIMGYSQGETQFKIILDKSVYILKDSFNFENEIKVFKGESFIILNQATTSRYQILYKEANQNTVSSAEER